MNSWLIIVIAICYGVAMFAIGGAIFNTIQNRQIQANHQQWEEYRIAKTIGKDLIHGGNFRIFEGDYGKNGCPSVEVGIVVGMLEEYAKTKSLKPRNTTAFRGEEGA